MRLWRDCTDASAAVPNPNCSPSRRHWHQHASSIFNRTPPTATTRQQYQHNGWFIASLAPHADRKASRETPKLEGMSTTPVLPKDIAHMPHNDYHPATDHLNFAESEVSPLPITHTSSRRLARLRGRSLTHPRGGDKMRGRKARWLPQMVGIWRRQGSV